MLEAVASGYIFEMLRTLPLLNGEAYAPRAVIQAVNTLQPLGKVKALAAIRQYMATTADDKGYAQHDGLFILMRVLFEAPAAPGYFPPLRIGRPIPPPPGDPRLFPRFPVLIIHDIPLLLVHGYMLLGVPEPVEVHVDYCQEHCAIRPAPLSPANHPLAVLEEVENLPPWHAFVSAASAVEGAGMVRARLMRQLLSLIHSVYRPENDGADLSDSSSEHAEEWGTAAETLRTLPIVWDPTVNDYRLRPGPPE